jgi:hypothetical protein
MVGSNCCMPVVKALCTPVCSVLLGRPRSRPTFSSPQTPWRRAPARLNCPNLFCSSCQPSDCQRCQSGKQGSKTCSWEASVVSLIE